MKRKIVIAGATGLVGKMLYETLRLKGYELNIITRDVKSAKELLPQATIYCNWEDKEGLKTVLNEAYALINLSGAPIIGKRWTTEYKKTLFDSRINTTHKLVEIIEKINTKPKILINGSAVGFYGIENRENPYTEADSAGNDFLAKLCESWENEAYKAEKYNCRVVCIRTGIILDKNEGALPQMARPFTYYVGGRIGSGSQWLPWIHSEDEIGIICFALENNSVKGPINAVAPQGVTNTMFSKQLGEILHKPSFFPVPSFILSLLFGEAADVLTNGVNISSQKIVGLGYTFRHNKLNKALRDIFATRKKAG